MFNIFFSELISHIEDLHANALMLDSQAQLDCYGLSKAVITKFCLFQIV